MQYLLIPAISFFLLVFAEFKLVNLQKKLKQLQDQLAPGPPPQNNQQ